MPTEDLLTTREVADLLGVTVRTVARMVDSGRLEVALKMPGRRGAMAFERAVVEQLAEAS